MILTDKHWKILNEIHKNYNAACRNRPNANEVWELVQHDYLRVRSGPLGWMIYKLTEAGEVALRDHNAMKANSHE